MLGRDDQLEHVLVARPLPARQCLADAEVVALTVEAQPASLRLRAFALEVHAMQVPSAAATILRDGSFDEHPLLARALRQEKRASTTPDCMVDVAPCPGLLSLLPPQCRACRGRRGAALSHPTRTDL